MDEKRRTIVPSEVMEILKLEPKDKDRRKRGSLLDWYEEDGRIYIKKGE